MTEKPWRLRWGIAYAMIACLLLIGIPILWKQSDFLLRALQSTDQVIEKPRAFGAFHLVCFFLCVALSVVAGVFGSIRKSCTDRLVLLSGLFLLILELYKQLYGCFVLMQGKGYDFSIFPFQFCSLPLYLYLVVPWLREGRGKDLLYRFLGLYATMGGCLVMAYPAFYDRASLCIHTMLWHTAMIATGVLILFSRGYGKSWRHEVLATSPVFLLSLGMATFLNLLLTPYAQNSPKPLNLFYMSPYQGTNFWVVREVRQAFGWGASLICYILLFVFVGATTVFFVKKGIDWGICRLKNEKFARKIQKN